MGSGSLKLIRVLSMLFMAVVCATTVSAQTFTTYGGEAAALSGTVAGIPVNLASTGAIDPSGGARNNSLVCYPGGPQCYAGVPDATSGLLSVQALNATAVGRGDRTHSYASLASLTLLVNGVTVKADYVAAMAKSECQGFPPAERPSVSVGKSEFSRLTIGGVPIAVTGQPNQVVTVTSPLGGTVTFVLNKQSVVNGFLEVRAMQVTAPSIVGVVNATNVTIGMATAKIECNDIDECFAAKVTSGGFVVVDNAKITFAASGRNLDTWGHVVAINHQTGDKFKAIEQETFFVNRQGEGVVAVIVGTGQVNGSGSYPFTAELQDNGEPGRDDRFGLTVGGPQAASFAVPFQMIAGGNIQFHKPKGNCPIPVFPDECDVMPALPTCKMPPPEEIPPPPPVE